MRKLIPAIIALVTILSVASCKPTTSYRPDHDAALTTVAARIA